MFRKMFTPQEANQRLPLIKKIVQDILFKGQTLQTLINEHYGDNLPEHCGELEEEIASLMYELDQLGCYYKDWNFEIGLVDFPAVIDGKEVFLCWRSDEPELRWYHGIEEGYDQRQLIPEELLKNSN